MLIIIHGQKQRIINFAENAPKTGKKKALRHSARHDDSSAVRENLVMASEGLGAYVYGLFSDIRAQTRCRSLSLYVISGENSMTRLFEYRDNSFIKTDSPHFDVIDLNSGLGRELSLGTTVILMEGKKAVLPLAARGRLMGTIHVLSDYSLEGSDIDAITTMTEPLLKKLADYLTLNTVMVNQDTGLFSETYFMMKYNETAGRSSARKKPFSLILLSLARDMKQLTEEQRKGVLKIITALLDEEITDDHFLCHYGTFIAVFLPESSEKVTRVTAEKIFKTLTRVRIALPSQDHLDLNPFMGWASSDMLTDPRGVLGQAHKNADRALVKDEANIQETPITV
jgi:GGDEF domain-containing protein